jgi:flagellar protein FliS
MWREAYLESRVLSADPVELICMLYQRAIDAVQNARCAVAAGDIAARSQSICHAIAVVSELDACLDRASGGAISQNLGELYQYIRQRLTEANMQQKEAPLAEVLSLLSTLAEGWRGVNRERESELASVPTPEPPVTGVWQSPDLAGAHAWCA